MIEPQFINIPMRRFDSIMAATVEIKLRIWPQDDARRLLNAWRVLLETVYLDDGTVVSGVFLLLFCIRRLATRTNRRSCIMIMHRNAKPYVKLKFQSGR